MAAESQSHHHQILLHRHHQREPPQRPPPSRGLRSTAGQIVEVQGGHIVRSTGRKDRHSKVCTAKGPRDRRVRLSAHTAIQFYDVQDRLGYDRPSKAVDWLIKNAKAAIDELAELPAWHPTATVVNTVNQENHGGGGGGGGETSNRDMHVFSEHGNSSNYHEFGSGGGGGDGGGSSSFLPPSLDSDAIADTIKSFFPIAAAAASSSAPSSSSSPIGFQSYPPPDLLSRASSQNQDLRLSLQSFQDPIFHHHQNTAHHQHQQNQNAAASHHHSLFSGFDAASMVPWEVAESSSGGGGGGGYVFSVPLQQQALAMHHGLSHGHVPGQSQQFFTQRGPLQSSNPPFVRAWAEPMAAAADHQMHHHTAIHHPIGFASGSSSGFSGFRIPARIQGEEEENDGKPSSTSSGSHH